MKLYIKQKVFSWNAKFTVKNELGEDKYWVEGEFFSLGRKLHIYNASGGEIASIEQKLFSLMPKYIVYVGGTQVAEIVREFTFMKPRYTIEGLNWDVNGDFWQHDYQITQNGNLIVIINKEWMTWGDTYELNIANPQDELIALAVVLAIDCVMAAQNN